MRLAGLFLLVLIRGYQLLISPLFPPSCRYYPTCSDYARQAVAQHGPAGGAWLTLRRLLRCHPWGGFGYDPVPEKAPQEHTQAGLGLDRACRHLEHHLGR
jgi:putative membrane protein insertion efficiency factor